MAFLKWLETYFEGMVVKSLVASRVQCWYSIDISWTCELAHSSRPPSGAKMTPTAKNSGSTVLGVRMGCQAFKRCCRKAVSMLSWSMSVRCSVESPGKRGTYWAVSCSFPSCHPVLPAPPASVSSPDPFVCLRAMMREAAATIS